MRSLPSPVTIPAFNSISYPAHTDRHRLRIDLILAQMRAWLQRLEFRRDRHCGDLPAAGDVSRLALPR
ncbi:hypothetical protein [Castellaniella sp.]|uniref:hypothetical protein n=1 Tax=Castellaniella sp. TaxID=1955812 RepID=UPI002AFF1962|nr:hypothetical protein [Castellaniella sp.]